MAKLAGFSPIIATASPRNAALLKSLGATHVLDRALPTDAALAELAKLTAGAPLGFAYDAISLADTPVDAMAVSFYKMFGFPTGVGALVVREDFLSTLRRPWFAGGTVDVVQAPGSIVTMTAELHERFEVS